MHNRKINEIPDHLFIKNPISGKLINILPMLELISDTFGGVDKTRHELQKVHDFLSTNVVVSSCPGSVVGPNYYADMNATLVIFREAIERMQEVPE